MTATTLVVGVDLARNSGHVADRAIDLAMLLGSRVVLVHAMQLTPGVRPDTIIRAPGHEAASAVEVLEADAQKHTAALLELLRDASIPVELVLGVGEPGDLLAKAAKEHGATMVLVGAPRKRALPRLWGTDLAAQIMAGCSSPVLLVPRTGPLSEDALSTAQFQLLAEVDG